MNLGVIALAVTLGSIIGMAAIIWDLWRENKRVNARADYVEREACRYIHHYNTQKYENIQLRSNAEKAQTHYIKIIGKQAAALCKFQRQRDVRGRFIKKGGS